MKNYNFLLLICSLVISTTVYSNELTVSKLKLGMDKNQVYKLLKEQNRDNAESRYYLENIEISRKRALANLNRKQISKSLKKDTAILINQTAKDEIEQHVESWNKIKNGINDKIKLSFNGNKLVFLVRNVDISKVQLNKDTLLKKLTKKYGTPHIEDGGNWLYWGNKTDRAGVYAVKSTSASEVSNKKINSNDFKTNKKGAFLLILIKNNKRLGYITSMTYKLIDLDHITKISKREKTISEKRKELESSLDL